MKDKVSYQLKLARDQSTSPEHAMLQEKAM
jgi:hypothetical protein